MNEFNESHIEFDIKVAAQQIRSHLQVQSEAIDKMLAKSMENMDLEKIQHRIDALVEKSLEEVIKNAIESFEVRNLMKEMLIESINMRRFNNGQQRKV